MLESDSVKESAHFSKEKKKKGCQDTAIFELLIGIKITTWNAYCRNDGLWKNNSWQKIG